MPPTKLLGLRPQTYEHPSDTSALNALSHNAGLDKLIRKLNGWGFERILRVELTGSYLRVTPDNFSELHGLLVKACDILDMPEVPGLYIAGGALNAFTAGVEKPLIVLYSGAIEALTNEEMLFVIAHELGHIKSAHVLYYQVAKFLPMIGEIVGSATLGWVNCSGWAWRSRCCAGNGCRNLRRTGRGCWAARIPIWRCAR